MPNPFDHVRPGDVINAQQFNLLLDTLSEMRTRIETLEAGTASTGVRITGFVPQLLAPVGSTVTIIGANFEIPPTDPVTGAVRNIIRIDGTAIPADLYVITGSGTTSQQIAFRVPTSLDSQARPLGQGGRAFEVTVENANGRASRSYTFTSSTSTLPQPTVTNVVRDGTQLRSLIPTSTARVTGTNFVAGATRVRMAFATFGYPAGGDQPLAVTVVSPTELTFPVPTINGVQVGIPTQFDLELTVDGAPSAAVFPTPNSGTAVTYTRL